MTLPDLSALYTRYETFSRIARDRFSGSLAGRLLLRSGLDPEGLAAMVAATIAGACSLCVEPEAERLRAALRAGLCDFVVTPLDEALRILKNELRRGLPISVGLAADPASTFIEMIDRGLQPDLVSMPPGQPTQAFIDRGAASLPTHDTPPPDGNLLEWTVTEDAVRAMPQIATVAAKSLDLSRPDTPSRQHWLRISARHLGRAFTARSCVRMTPQELTVFVAAARTQFPAIRLASDGANV